MVDVSALQFDMDHLDGSIAESGLASEFDIDPQSQRLLAMQAHTLVSLALGHVRDEDFEANIDLLDLPDSPSGVAFLFGFCEHIRGEVLQAIGDAEQKLALRSHLQARLKRAQEICRSRMRPAGAGLQSM